VSTAQRRRPQPVEATIVEVCAGLGALIGLLTVVSGEASHPSAPKACSTAAVRAGTCLGQQLSQDLMPYLRGGLIGLAVGGVISLVLVLLFLRVRRELAVRRFRTSIPVADPAGPSPSTSVAAPVPRRRRAIPERVRHEVWRRDEACCVDCGSRERLEFDHIIPVSKGGSNTARNIELRCELCNGYKSARI
jgi:hypothetical protein